MPVTGKLSRKFYETLGDEVTNELVDWLNAVDAAYKANLKEHNDRNFQRFEDRLNERFAQFDAKWEKRVAELDAKWEKRLAEVESRLRGDMGEMKEGFARVREEMAALRADIIKWMFLFWVGTGLTVLGLLKF